MKSDHKNVTLSLPEPLLRKFRVYAAKQNKSMTTLMAEAVRKLVENEESEYEKGRRILAENLRNPPNLGTHGKATWTREEVHER